MIFTQEAVSKAKNRDGKDIFSKLGLDMGIMSIGGLSLVGATLGPATAIVSIAMLMKLPSVIRGISYVKNDMETFIPEYRVLLKDKYLKGHYENQFKKLAVDYIDNSSSLLEKRFKAEFITEWLHSAQIYTFELKKSGFSQYCTNLKKDLIEAGMYGDRTAPSTEVDTGLTFGGYCDNDETAKIQRKVFEDFKDEGIVGNLIIRGGNAKHLDGLIALQDYKLTEKDQKVIQEFIDLPASEFFNRYMNKKISGTYFTKESTELVANNLSKDSRERLDIAGSVLAVGHKIKEIQKYIKESRVKLKEPAVGVHSGFNIDLDILSENYNNLDKKQNVRVKV